MTITDDQILKAYMDCGTVRGAARILGMPPSTLKGRMFRIQEKQDKDGAPEIHIPDNPESDESVEDILNRKRRLFERKKASQDFHKLVPVTVKHSGAIAVTLIGDPHIDDDGCDIHALERDLDVIKKTPAMYAGHLGDLTNNWVGRLARLYANQTTTAAQAIKLMEWMLEQAPNLFVVGGNHDCWNHGMDIISFVMRQQRSVVNAHGLRIALNFESGKQVRIHARHVFNGHSQYNPTHGHRKEQLWAGNRDHIYCSGHKHTDGASVIPHTDGACSWAFQVSGYKVIDEYAHEGGYHEQRMAPSVTVLINPNAKKEAELVKPYWDTEAAADYLTFIRRRK